MIYRGGKRLSKNELVGLDIVLTCGSIVRTGLSIEFSKWGLAEDILSERIGLKLLLVDLQRRFKRLSKKELIGLDIVLTCGSIVRTGLQGRR